MASSFVGRHTAGVLLVAGCAVVGTWAAGYLGTSLLGFAKSPVSGVMMAILLGLVIAQLAPRQVDATLPTLRFFTTTVLRTGIVLLGTRLSIVAVSALGLQALPVVVLSIVAALSIVLLVGRAMRLPLELGLLIAVGTAICGVTAIAATAPLIRARALEVSYATGCVALFGMLALLIHPFIAHALFGAQPVLAGIFLGTAVHDTAQVAGAAMLYMQQYADPVALEAATVTKLLRNLFMAVVIPFAAVLASRARSDSPTPGTIAKRPPLVPLFVAGFIGMCVVRTIGDLGDRPFGLLSTELWSSTLLFAQTLSEWCLIAAMAAVGLQTRLDSFAKLGFRPLLLGLIAASLVGVVSAISLSILAAYF
ncbi:MAG: putative sulfate exporter family transporter [Pseudomonadales bacterium]|nr:putative sulfate exporter family transporter [Pseudomonadales bacterium]